MTTRETIEVIKGFRNLIYTDDLDGMEKSDEDKKAIDIAIDALEKQEKYRWHDLRKNPEDLPTEKGIYLVSGTWGGQKPEYWLCEFANYGALRGWVNGALNPRVIAWRYIEPFEEDNE